METIKQLYNAIVQSVESLNPLKQSIIAFSMWIIAHLSHATAIIAFLVLLFNFKIVYYKSKNEKLKYEKECKGLKK